MCLAIPGKVKRIDTAAQTAVIDYDGVERKAGIALLSDVAVGDFVLVHAGFAIQKVDERVARETYRLLAEAQDDAEADLKEKDDAEVKDEDS